LIISEISCIRWYLHCRMFFPCEISRITGGDWLLLRMFLHFLILHFNLDGPFSVHELCFISIWANTNAGVFHFSVGKLQVGGLYFLWVISFSAFLFWHGQTRVLWCFTLGLAFSANVGDSHYECGRFLLWMGGDFMVPSMHFSVVTTPACSSFNLCILTVNKLCVSGYVHCVSAYLCFVNLCTWCWILDVEAEANPFLFGSSTSAW